MSDRSVIDKLLSRFTKPRFDPSRVLGELKKLSELLKQFHEVHELPELLIPVIVELFEPDVARYYTKEPTTSYFRRVVAWPESFWNAQGSKFEKRRPAHEGAIGRAVKTKQLVVIDKPEQAAASGDYIPVDSRVSHEIVLPILARENLGTVESVVALVVLSRFSQVKFSHNEQQLLSIVGSMVSSVYNSSLGREQREKRIEFFRDVTDLRTIDLDALFHQFLSALSKVVPSKFTSLWLYNELDDTLVVRAFYPTKVDQKSVSFQNFDSRILNCAKTFSGQVIAAKRPRVFKDVQHAEEFSNRGFATRFDLEWFVSVPVLDGNDRPLAVINIWPSLPPDAFDEDTLMALSGFTAPLANTVKLASLLFEEQLLFSYDDFFQGMLEFEDQRSSWDRLASLIRNQMRCEACSIFLAETDGLLHLKGSTGLEGNPPYSSVVYSANEGLTGTAYVQEKPMVYYKETRKQHLPLHISKFRENIIGKSKSIIFVQVKDKDGRNIGVIRCNNKEETPARHVGRFTVEDILQLQKISKLISQAHSRISFVNEKEKERERNTNSLHHEILSPVDGILAHIEWIENHFSHIPSPGGWNKERLLLKFSDMKQNSKLIDVIVTSMGRFDQDIRLNVRPVSLPALLHTCIGFIQHEAFRKRVKVTIEYLGLPVIKGDELQLMRVFYNLLRNAIKYSDPNESDRFIRIYTLPDEKNERYADLYFADNGIGIVPGEETLIFQMFVRGSLAPKYFPEGSGLGLAFCKKIMEKHGGNIEIAEGGQSKPTVFRLSFPEDQVP